MLAATLVVLGLDIAGIWLELYVSIWPHDTVVDISMGRLWIAHSNEPAAPWEAGLLRHPPGWSPWEWDWIRYPESSQGPATCRVIFSTWLITVPIALCTAYLFSAPSASKANRRSGDQEDRVTGSASQD
jgi:hypothetical protein